MATPGPNLRHRMPPHPATQYQPTKPVEMAGRDMGPGFWLTPWMPATDVLPHPLRPPPQGGRPHAGGGPAGRPGGQRRRRRPAGPRAPPRPLPVGPARPPNGGRRGRRRGARGAAGRDGEAGPPAPHAGAGVEVCAAATPPPALLARCWLLSVCPGRGLLPSKSKTTSLTSFTSASQSWPGFDMGRASRL